MDRPLSKLWVLCVLLLLTPIVSVHASDDSAKRPNQVTAQPSTPSQDGAPSGDIPEASHDLGKISKHRKYEHAFLVLNLGTAPLEIKEVLPG